MFDISAETVTIVKSVTISLTGDDVARLADALPALRELFDKAPLVTAGLSAAPLQPACDLLVQLDAIRNGYSHAATLGVSPAADPVAASTPPKKKQRSGPSPVLDLAQLQTLCDQNLPTAEIAARLGCHPTTVNKAIRNNGIRRTSRRRKRGQEPASPDPQSQDQD